FFSSRRRHTRFSRDWSSDVCSCDLEAAEAGVVDEDVEAAGRGLDVGEGGLDGRAVGDVALDGREAVAEGGLHVAEAALGAGEAEDAGAGPYEGGAEGAAEPPARAGDDGHLVVEVHGQGAGAGGGGAAAAAASPLPVQGMVGGGTKASSGTPAFTRTASTENACSNSPCRMIRICVSIRRRARARWAGGSACAWRRWISSIPPCTRRTSSGTGMPVMRVFV